MIQEAPIDVALEDNPTNEPEPDIVVVKREVGSFVAGGPPCPDDLHLVIEVADTTLRFELTVKAALYARAGAAEYWVLDVVSKRLIVHRDPKGPVYSSVAAVEGEESIAPLSAPGAKFRVSDVVQIGAKLLD